LSDLLESSPSAFRYVSVADPSITVTVPGPVVAGNVVEDPTAPYNWRPPAEVRDRIETFLTALNGLANKDVILILDDLAVSPVAIKRSGVLHAVESGAGAWRTKIGGSLVTALEVWRKIGDRLVKLWPVGALSRRVLQMAERLEVGVGVARFIRRIHALCLAERLDVGITVDRFVHKVRALGLAERLNVGVTVARVIRAIRPVHLAERLEVGISVLRRDRPIRYLAFAERLDVGVAVKRFERAVRALGLAERLNVGVTVARIIKQVRTLRIAERLRVGITVARIAVAPAPPRPPTNLTATFPQATPPPATKQVTLNLGSNRRIFTDTQIRWQTNYSGYTLFGPLVSASNANVSALGVSNRWVQGLKIDTLGAANCEMLVASNSGTSPSQPNGQDLPVSWETSPTAFTFRAPTLSDLVVPGPNFAGNDRTDSGEQYIWRPSATVRAAMATWIAAFRRLSTAQQNQATVTLAA